MSSSELSDHDVEMDAPQELNNKRRSGRVSRRPNHFTEPQTSSKRKRVEPDEDALANGGEDQDEGDEEDEDDESESEGEPDEEEKREQRARARKAKRAPTKKPVAKRPKTNGTTVALPVRGPAKPSRKKAKALDEDDADQAGGLYGQLPIFPSRSQHKH